MHDECWLSPVCNTSTHRCPHNATEPRVVDLMPFSATLQWDPPSDNGGSSLPLTYTVTLTNTSISLPFSNLQHSTQYSWSVQTINEFHTSPPAEGTFCTNDTGECACACKYWLLNFTNIMLIFSANLVMKFIIFSLLYSCPARPLVEGELPLN